MAKNSIWAVCFIIGFSSCKKQETYCNVKEPVVEMAWIQDVIKTSPYNLWIYKLTYQSTEGIYIYACQNADCSEVSVNYRTCDNTLLYQLSPGGVAPGSFPYDFTTQTVYRELIYRK